MTTTDHTPTTTIDAGELRAGDTVHTTGGPARVLHDPESAPGRPGLVTFPLITADSVRNEWTVRADRRLARFQG